jgi:DNA-binding transcriptional LysR family regulator
MRIEQLEYLLEIKRSKSMKLAAENLFVSYQAVNAAIHKLEDELHTALVDRTNRGTALTERGLVVADFAQRFLEEWANLTAGFTQAVVRPPGSISIYTTEVIHQFQLKTRLLGFAARYPGFDIGIMLASLTDIYAILNDVNEADVIGIQLLSPEELKHIPENIGYSILCAYRLYAVVNKLSRISRRKVLSLADLLPFPVFSYFNDYQGQELAQALFQKYFPGEPISIVSDVSIENKEFMLNNNMAIGLRYLSPNVFRDLTQLTGNCKYIPITEQENNFLVCFYHPKHYPELIMNWFSRVF